MSAFLSINCLLICFVSINLHILGATWDAGGPYEKEYNVDFYDYQFMPYFATVFISNIRTAVGDLQAPGYNYWGE